MSLGLAFGAQESAKLNGICEFTTQFIYIPLISLINKLILLVTVTNLSVVLFVIICGCFKINWSNWSIPADKVPDGYGEGGFLPYGFVGVIKGAAICFYGFIGFDVIATAGEEAKDPKKSIPLAVCISLLIIFLAYFGISSVLTLMLPYYEQDENSPLPFVFKTFGWTVAQYIVTFGAIFGLFASLMGSMFPLPRVIYAIAVDGLLFEIFGKVHPRYKTPFWGTILAGLLTGALSTFFDLSQLVSMMSIGTVSYTNWFTSNLFH